MSDTPFGRTTATVVCPICASKTIEHLALSVLKYHCLDCSASFDETGERVVFDYDG